MADTRTLGQLAGWLHPNRDATVPVQSRPWHVRRTYELTTGGHGHVNGWPLAHRWHHVETADDGASISLLVPFDRTPEEGTHPAHLSH